MVCKIKQKAQLYGVFCKKNGFLVSHKIHREPKETFFPALFTNFDDAVDYASGVGDVYKVNLTKLKKRMYEDWYP